MFSGFSRYARCSTQYASTRTTEVGSQDSGPSVRRKRPSLWRSDREGRLNLPFGLSRPPTLPRVIKYLGSKRALAPALGALASASGSRTALDLFTGSTRVAQEFKRRGIHTTAADIATYSAVLAQCFIATDARTVDRTRLAEVLDHLNTLPGRPGYVTATFCEQARYFQPHNGARIDAIRDELAQHFVADPLLPILLTSLLLAADRVDSTAGMQQAYLKSWSRRSYNALELREPELLSGTGESVLGDAREVVEAMDPVDLAYLDPPYNQHRYFTNYHIWETLIRWDSPEHYGIACKRIDARDPASKSIFNKKREMPSAFTDLLRRTKAQALVVSYNDEAWISPEQMLTALHETGHDDVTVMEFDHERYVGARIGIYSPRGVKVGQVTRVRNVEYLYVAGLTDDQLAQARREYASGRSSVDTRRTGGALSTRGVETGGPATRP